MRFDRLLGAALIMFLLGAAPAPVRHPLTIDDVMTTVMPDRIAVSPNGEWVAAVLPRPAGPGEVAGRNAYEIDPSRNDVWLISRRTGERQNLTNGAAAAAGFWCATWSPDGQMLAMLSTKPDGAEPRGGDNVRLYVWDRSEDRLRRLSAAAVMTQGRYGSGLYALDVRGGADGGSIAHQCRANDENAPFAWIDDHRLIALMLAPGEVSALLDQYGRPFDEAAKTRAMLREGRLPTVTAVGSGDARVQRDEARWRTTLNLVDARNGSTTKVADVPIYPFSGALTVSIAPDLRRAAIMAPVRRLPFTNGVAPSNHAEDWYVEKRLGVVDLLPGSQVRWVALPIAAQLPLELFDWNPDGKLVALRAREALTDRTTSAFVLDIRTLLISPVGEGLTFTKPWLDQKNGESLALWRDKDTLLVRARRSGAQRDDWWLIGAIAPPINISAALATLPDTFRRRADGSLLTVADDRLAILRVEANNLTPVGGALRKGATILFPHDPSQPSATLMVGAFEHVDTVDTATGRRLFAARLGTGAIHALNRQGLVWSERTLAGLFLRETSLNGGATRELLALNKHLAAVKWGEKRIIDYRTAAGDTLKAAVILPPGYRPDRRYPVLTWVYGGHLVRGLDDYWLNPYAPGIYNLQLYAAQGYVVLIPSIPLTRESWEDLFMALPTGVMPAIDQLVALGIADPDRVAVMGQSFGGYTVYLLVSQTDRFRAAIAVAGITDPAQAWGQFDPGARGYSEIEDEKSGNWSIWENGDSFGAPPYAAPDRWNRASALAHVNRVQTPLLMIHGELDLRDPLAQIEPFYFALSRQGKTARLLRYWGENHSLAASPANVRDVYRETLAWLDRYNGPRSTPNEMNATGAGAAVGRSCQSGWGGDKAGHRNVGAVLSEPRRDCRRLQLLRRRSRYEQDNEQVFTRDICPIRSTLIIP